MSVVERPRTLSTRLLRSELRLIFGRRRNIAGFGVLACVPVIIAVAIAITGTPGAGEGPDFLSQVTSNGLFVGLVALGLEVPLFLPLAVAAISGDAVAGEANLGTLRYLLAVPVHRTRMLAVKYLAIVIFAVAAVLLVVAVGVILGLLLFGAGPVTLLSGSQIGTAEGLGRLLLICGYLSVCLASFGAIGLFVSTLTEQPIGATIAVVGLAVVSQILDSISAVSAIHPYLPTHYWLAFGDLLRDPISTDLIATGLLSAVVYAAIFWTAAWARFSGKDVTS
ncbi:MAG: ABC transporter permease subunit [Geodermatophilaceae bacterium]|nr:ABC transporter permease subunit [Geodermatophilaceae bacterium]